MNTKKMKTLLPSFMLAALLSVPSYAQVTIGSGIEPEKGALLDLKEQQKSDGTENATKGLMLPRVNLSDLNKLFPMFTGAYDAAEDPKHTGLTVYNLNKCFDTGAGKGGQGVYVWSGTQWDYIGTAQNIQGSTLGLLSSLYGTTDASGNLWIDIPSGLDARGATILPFDLTVNSDPLASVTDVTIGLLNGGVVFSPAQAWTTGALAANPTVYSGLQATDMSGLTDIGTTNPWRTRQTVLEFSGLAGCPPVTASRTVTLNQTNYAIVASTSNATSNPAAGTYVTAPVVFRNTTPTNIYIHSNVQWKAAPSMATASALPSVLGTTYTTSDNTPAGSDKSDETKVQPQFTYTVVAGETGTRYKTVDMVFSDVVNPRANPYTITMMQCQGTEDLNGLQTEDAANSDRSDWKTVWGTDVILHGAKANPNYQAGVDPAYQSNIYEKFVSADFDTAGRWMTTNLAAWAYESNISTATLPDFPDISDSNTVPHWYYPNGSSSGSTSYNINPHLGLLYNWPAATAKNTSTADEANVNHEFRQGICPNGWHVPSDYEWNILEKEIYEHPERYSSYTDNSSFPQTNWDPNWNTAINYRPTSTATQSHGQAMKEVCGVNTTIPNGLSKYLVQNGFNVLLAGSYYNNGTALFYSTRAYLWSSSSAGSEIGWFRTVTSAECRLSRRSDMQRFSFMSVRCKKNE
ncbi:FISUMP domain-containing protein [Dysgonomonas sp. BGC7]|uniref:FISUMP domain-containing protein n=1 Tax=Dysgonomonas sp. BGC7 TaxID=1658008 RepID=UPI0006815E33|nr:FISUMP domain-containing protein [Dysgonomonas sp. BGC7]MBD8388168.1 fibrobacter succinogenes major paralogous domain-containing protein [Dysgonomonas sp. BGC7]